MDLFTIGVKADTSQLKRGERDLDSFAKTGEKVNKVLDKYGNELTENFKAMGRFIDKTGRMREANGRFVKGLEKTSTSLGGATKNSDGFGRSIGAATAAVTAFISAAGVMQGLRLADQYQLMNDRIGLATEATGDFAAVQAELFKISQETGTGLQNNVELFDRIRIGAQELGRSNKEVLQLVEAIDQLGASGGTSQEALGNATLQLSQALAGGVLRAEEFNSVVENTPKIAQAIAEGLNTSIGGLRQMVLAGGVLADDVFEALLSQSDKIATNFEQMPVRMGRATTAFSNSLTKAFGELDEASGLTSSLAGAITDLSETIDGFTDNTEDLGKTAQALEFIGTTAIGAAGAYATYTAGAYAARVATLALTASMATNPIGLAVLAFGAAGGAIYAYTNNTNDAVDATGQLISQTDTLRNSVVGLEHAYKGLSRQSLLAEERRLIQLQAGLEENLAEQIAISNDSPIDLPSLGIAREMLQNVTAQLEGVTAELAKYKAVADEVKKDSDSDAIQIPTFEVQQFSESLEGSLNLDEYRAKIEQLAATYAPVKTELETLKAAQVEIIRLMAIAGSEDLSTLKGALAEVNKQIEGLTTAEGIDWEGIGATAAGSITNALIDGDWTSAGNQIGSTLGSSIGMAMGGPIGAAIGGAIGGSLFGTKKKTGSSTTVGLSGGMASGSTTTNFKKSGLFGGSSSITEDLGLNELTQLNNSLNYSFGIVDQSLSKLTGGIVVGFDEFNRSVKVAEGDLSGAIDQLSDAYVDANVSYIEDFQRVNETAFDALKRLSSMLASVQGSFEIVQGDALENAASSFIQSQADAIRAGLNSQIASASVQRSQASAEINRLQKAISDAWDRRESGDNLDIDEMAFYAEIARQDAMVKALTNQINEASSRIPQAMAMATAQFTNGVLGTIASLEGINQDEAADVFAQLAFNYEENYYSSLERVERATERARDELAQFSDLGISAGMSMTEFRTAFEAFINSSAFTPQGYSRFLLAADALADLNEVTQEVDDSGALKSITDFVRDLMGLAADGTQTLASAKAAYDQALTASLAGDDEALGKLTSYADAYLTIAANSLSTSAQLAGVRANVIGDLTGLTGSIPAYANGTSNHSGGWAMVGERGAELVNLPTGSSVTTASNTAKMLDNSNLLDAVNQLINIMQTGQYEIAKATKDSYKIFNGWNKIGLPKERII